jgi:tellurium resistance protein TerD
MAINLKKGQSIDLRKNEKGENVYDLSTVTIGLGWDVRKKSSSFLGNLFGSKEEEYDLDAIAFLLDKNGKVVERGRTIKNKSGKEIPLFESDVIYFNSLKHPSGHIWLTGDNRTGAGAGDDEQIIVKLNSLDQKYQKILFLVTIYHGKQNNQHFGLIENAFIRAVDANGKEITKYSLSGDATLNGMCSMVFAEVFRNNGQWEFKALGEANQTDNFVEILKKYVATN